MTRITFFALSVLALVVVLRKPRWGTGANGVKGDKGTRHTARRPEHGGKGGSSKTRETYPKRKVVVREVLYSDTQPEERMLLSAVRVAGYYVFLGAVVFAASVVLGGVVAVGMEYLVGWPDTWLL